MYDAVETDPMQVAQGVRQDLVAFLQPLLLHLDALHHPRGAPCLEGHSLELRFDRESALVVDVGEPTPAEAAATQAAVDEVVKLPDHYFELYTLAMEMADRTSARRLTANTFFVTVNTGLAALLGAHNFQWYVAVAGIVLCAAWWALLKSYRDLNSAKFNAVINPMEERLPARIFSDEWAALRRDSVKLALNRSAITQWLGRYWELGVVERVVPIVFALIYLLNLLSRI